MERPRNPYKPGSLKWSLMEGGLQGEFDGLPGWEDLTVPQIAEVFDVTNVTIYTTLYRIEKETGYRVQRAKAPRGSSEVSTEP